MIPAASKVLALGFAVLFTGLFSPAGAQAPERPRRWDPDWQAPRTAWGHPDLQGNWSNATLTPLQRRRGAGPVYTWSEVDRIEGREQARVEAGYEPSAPDRPVIEPGKDHPQRFALGEERLID